MVPGGEACKSRASGRGTHYLPLDGRVAGAIRLQSSVLGGSGEERKGGERDDGVDVAGVRKPARRRSSVQTGFCDFRFDREGIVYLGAGFT